MTFITLLGIVAVSCLLCLPTSYSLLLQHVIAPNNATLRSEAVRHGLRIGSAANIGALTKDAQYRSVLSTQFDILTPENSMKWPVTEPSRGKYNFAAGDAIVSFAANNSMWVRGHNLAWHANNPTWLLDPSLSPDELKTILHDHISAVAGHYKGKVQVWDVVNEAMGHCTPDCTRTEKESVWQRAFSGNTTAFIAQAMIWAHAADPNATLFYNDFKGEGEESHLEAMGRKSDAIYKVAEDLVKAGVPLGGIGLQTHLKCHTSLTKSAISANIRRLGALGLQVHITELDVKMEPLCTSAKQAEVYDLVLQACLDNEGVCTAFVTWGFTDKYSFISKYKGDMYDSDMKPKPAYQALLASLA